MGKIRTGLVCFAVVVMVAVTGAQHAPALHANAIVDCGAAGTFALRTTPTGAGLEAPPPGDVLLFEGGGTLTILSLSFGQVIFDPASVGRAKNHVEEVTCVFTLANGVDFEVIGVFTRR